MCSYTILAALRSASGEILVWLRACIKADLDGTTFAYVCRTQLARAYYLRHESFRVNQPTTCTVAYNTKKVVRILNHVSKPCDSRSQIW